MITNNLTMGKIKAAEDNIYNIIKMKKKYKTQSILVYDDYNTLFQLFLKYNPEKVKITRCRPSDLEKRYSQKNN